jgi:hypothetical protein
MKNQMSHLEYSNKPKLEPLNAFREIRAYFNANQSINLVKVFGLMKKYKCLDSNSPDYQKCYDYIHQVIKQILKTKLKVNDAVLTNIDLPNISFIHLLIFCKATQDFTWLDLCFGLTINDHKELADFLEATVSYDFKNLRILSIEDITLSTDQIIQIIKLIKSSQIKTVVFTNKPNSKHEKGFLEAIPDLNLLFQHY